MKPHKQTDLTGLELGRNPSYRRSVELAVKRLLWPAPWSLVGAVLLPVTAGLYAIFWLAVIVFVWVALRLIHLVAGLAGYLRETHVRDRQSALKDHA